MCYSEEVSLGTFLFVAVGAAFLWQRNNGIDRPFGLLLLVVALMQLVEFFLWRNLDCTPANQFWSRMIPFALILQPLLSLFILWKFKAGWGAGYKELFFIVLILFVPLMIQFWKKVKGCSTLDEHGHLVWPEETFTLSPTAYWTYWLGTTYSYATLKDPILGGLMVLFHFVSYHGANLLYPRSWSSMWCHFANSLIVLGVARPYLWK